MTCKISKQIIPLDWLEKRCSSAGHVAHCGAVEIDASRKIPNTEKLGAPLKTGSEPAPAARLSPVDKKEAGHCIRQKPLL